MNRVSRFWEVDVLRALAFFCMLVQHTAVVWNYIQNGSTDVSFFLKQIGGLGAVVFLFLVGVSGYLSYQRYSTQTIFWQIEKKFLLRGISLLGWGCLLSFISLLFVPSEPVVFGVLSFIGFSVIFLPYFCKYSFASWFFLVLSVVLGFFLQSMQVSTTTFLIFGLYPSTFFSVDYWPLFPWLGLVVAGVEVAKKIYHRGNRSFRWFEPRTIFVRLLAVIGRNTLWLYILHIPVLYLLLLSINYLIS